MAESLSFNVGANTQNFQDGINGLLGKLAGLVAAFVSAQAIIEAFGQAIDLGSRLHDLSTRTGETAGNLALLERAFTNTGVSADSLGPAIAKMQRSMVDAADGSGAAAKAFEALSISMGELQGKSPTEQLGLIGERLALVVDPAERAALAMAIFGRSGSELLPVLVNFGSELDQAKGQLGSLPEMLTRTAASVDGLGDNLAAIRGKTTELAYGFLSEVVPALEAFTGKLSGVDAASIGAGLAQSLVGAFTNPMKAAELLSQSLVLGAKVMGNELVYQIQYWSQLMFNTFGEIGTHIIPMLGNNMRGAFELAVASFGTILVDVISGALESMRGIADVLGFGDELDVAIAKVQGVHDTLNTVMANGAARLEESANSFAGAFERAQANSTVVRQDFFGAAEAAQGIEEAFAALKNPFEFDSAEAAEGRTTTGSDTTLLDTIQAIDGVKEATEEFGTTAASAGSTVSSAVAAINSQLSLLAGLNPDQLIGPSASARKADDIDQQINGLVAQGEDPNSSRIQNLRDQRDRHRNIASGLGPSEADKEAARDYARDNLADSDKSFDKLYQEALDDIEKRKREEKGLPPKDEQDKKKDEDEKTPEEDKSKPKSAIDKVLQLLERIEPRIPVPNLA